MLKIECQLLRRVVSVLSSAFDKGSMGSPSSRNIVFKDGKAILSGKSKTIECECEFNEPTNFVAPFEELSKVASFGEPSKFFRLKPREAGGCHIGYGDWKWLLVCEPESAWMDQSPPEANPMPAMRLPMDEFIRGVRSVLFARAKHADSNVALDSVLFEIKDGEVFFVASDGRRCAVFMTEIDQAVDDTSILVDGRTLESVVSVAAKRDEGEAIQVLYSKGRLTFEFDGVTIRTIRPSYSYPDWRKLFGKDMPEPNDFGSTASEIEEAIERVSVCCGEESNGVGIAATEGVLTVDATGSGASAAKVKLTGSNKSSDAVINPSFLTDWLGTLEGCEPVRFSLGGQGTSDHAMFASDGRRYLVCRIDKS
jgi:hypothetical protein